MKCFVLTKISNWVSKLPNKVSELAKIRGGTPSKPFIMNKIVMDTRSRECKDKVKSRPNIDSAWTELALRGLLPSN